MKQQTIGFAMCGSFCTLERSFAALQALKKSYPNIIPIVSEAVTREDTRFGTAKEHLDRLRDQTGREPLCTLTDVEPIGPKRLLNALVICPCTGNTLGKLAHGIADGAVTLAAKAHLRNGRPIIIAISSNDALAAGAENLGRLLNRKNYFFVPFYQDSPEGKPTSLLADLDLLVPALDAALAGRQLQPLLLQK